MMQGSEDPNAEMHLNFLWDTKQDVNQNHPVGRKCPNALEQQGWEHEKGGSWTH